MPATQPDDMPAVFEQAFNTGDIDQVLALYEPDGSGVDLGGNTTEVIRRQADGTWRYVIDDPFSVV
ncbi:MAG: hypothetical protein JOY61_22870 [Chloroflexi bacterium]|nr:hypothetical protein [Chloroflexota bacterium]